MSAITWTNERTLHLINLYRSFDLLWDPASPDFKHRNKKQDAWDSIAEELNEDKQEVERKMRNLICHFYREHSKCAKKKAGSGKDDVKESRWFAYSSLLFVKDKNKPKSTIEPEGYGSVHESMDENLNDSLNATSEMDDDGHEDTTDEPHFEEPTDGKRPEASQQPRRIFKAPKKFCRTPGTYLFHRGTDAQTVAAFDMMNSAKKRFESRTTKDFLRRKDEYDCFGEQVAFKLRKLRTPYAKELVQHKISTLLFEAFIGKYDEQDSRFNVWNRMPSPSSSTPSSALSFGGSPSPVPTSTISPIGNVPVNAQPDGHSEEMHEGSYYILGE